MRAEARTVSRLLKCFAQLQHRGCGNTLLGAALASALQPAPVTAEEAAAASSAAPARPPGVFYVPGEWEPFTAVEPLVYYKGKCPVPLRATRTGERQPSVMAELFCVFNREIDMCSQLLKRGEPRTRYEKRRHAQAHNAIGIIELAHAREAG